MPESLFSQAGKNGSKTVTSTVQVNEYTVLTADAAAGATTLNVVSSTLNSNGYFGGSLSPGDLLFIIQIQGAQINTTDDSTYGTILNLANCGNHEFVQVASVPGATMIGLSCALQKNYTSTGRTQIVRVPRYSDLTISSTGNLTCPAWNGTTGGVLAVEVSGNTVINSGGLIDVSGKGFRGGALLENLAWWGVGNSVSPNQDYGSEKGEGVAGYQFDYDAMGGRYSKGAPANGGGGANAHNAGGGGGANAGSPAAWTGRGNPDLANATWASAWNLEYSGFASSTSSGGGKGGYTFSASNQNALSVGPSNSAWGGDQRGEQGGRGGRPLNYSSGKIFLGGGGGAGDQNNNAGGAGGAGGGIVYLLAYGDVSGAGQIRSNGTNGGSTIGANGTDGAGGGGAGGTILVPALGNISGISMNANGGSGGNQTVAISTLEAEGPGGGGGGGYIAVSNGAIARSAAGGQNGTTNCISMTEFPPNGATKGGSGESTAILPVFKINAASPQIVCSGSPATLSFTTTGTPPAGTNLGWYTSSVGGTLLGTGNTLTLGPVSANAVVYVGSCPGVYRQAIQLNADLVNASFTSNTVCRGTATTFSASASSSLGTITGWSWDFGNGTGTSNQQNPVYTYPASGTYTVQLTVTDDKGCSSVISNSVTVNPSPTVSFSTANAAGCLPMNVQFTNASSNASAYTWNFGDASATSSQTNPSHIYTTAGTYSVTLTASNASGCTSSQTISNMIQVSAVPRAVFSSSATSVCLGDTVRFTDLSLPNGTSIVSRSWDFGDGSALSSQTNPSHAYASAGTYVVRLTVASASCSHDTSLSILVNPGPVVSFSSSVHVGCSPLSVSFTNTTSGAPVYSWNFGDGSNLSGAVSPTHVYSAPGTYSVTLIATQGSCADTLRIQSMVVVYPTPGASFNSASSVCLGDTLFFANTSTSNGGITGYSWDFGDGSAVSNQTSPYHIYASPGSYQVTLRCSTNQCIDDTVRTVVISPSPQVSFTPSVTGGCAPLNVSFSNATTGSPVYSWDFGDGNASSLGTPSHVYSAPGNYSVTLIATQGSCGDTLRLANLISVIQKPQASFSSQSGLCLGDTLFILNSTNWNGSPAGTYTWDFGDGSAQSSLPNPNHLYTNAGTYTLTLTANGSQCSDDSSLSILVAPSPVAAFTSSSSGSCLPAIIQFTNTTGGSPSFTWNFGDNTSSTLRNPLHTYSNSGTYTVSLIATQGSCSDTLTYPAMISVLPAPEADFSFSSACTGDSISFTNLSLPNGSTISSYTWDFGDGSAVSHLTSPKHLYANSGNYTVNLLVQSSNNCTDTISRTISVLARPLVSFTPDQNSACDSLTVHFSNTSTGANSYSWSFGDGNVSSVINPTHTYTAPGSYTILLTAEATGGCSASRAFVNMIVVHESPRAQFTSSVSSICPGECIAFTDLSSPGVTGWSWHFPGANPSAAANASPASVCYPDTGSYPVSLTVSNGFCSDSVLKNSFVRVVDCASLPVAAFVSSDTTLCEGSCVSFVSLSLNATSWQWSFPGGTPSSSLTESPLNVCYPVSGNYDVKLIVTNLSGTDTIYLSNFIQVYPSPLQPVITQHGDSLLASAAFSYQWFLNGIAISGANSQLLIAPLSGNYSVETTDIHGCSKLSAAKYISLVGIDELSVPYVYIYPVPCSEELNLFLYTSLAKKAGIKVYNALGQTVHFQSEELLKGENRILINMSVISPGIYWLEIDFSGRRLIRRIVRQ